MPTEPGRRKPFAAFRHAGPVIGLGVGVLILVLAVPRTIAAFQLLPGDPVVQSVRDRKAVSEENLEMSIQTRNDAREWVSSARIQKDLSLAYLKLARREGYGGETGGGYLRESIEALKTGLSLSPADPYAWARLAFARIKNGSTAADVKRALFLSFLTGPHEKRLAISRIQYAILLWHRLDPDQRALVLDQISWADGIGKRRALAQMAKRHKTADAVIFLAIARDPKRLRGYLRSLRSLKK